jgi:hypothetical protein
MLPINAKKTKILHNVTLDAKINFATSQKCRIFAVDFDSEITEALYAFCAKEPEKLHSNAESV